MQARINEQAAAQLAQQNMEAAAARERDAALRAQDAQAKAFARQVRPPRP